jgi:hypothetical protein
MLLQKTDDSKSVILIDDNGQSLTWNVSMFERTRFVDIDTVFRDINGYFEFLPPDRRQKIWDAYQEIWNTFDQVYDPNRLASKLTGQLAALYELMPQAELEHWLKFYGQVVYPPNLKLEHDPLDKTPQRTYLKSDYQGLVMLVVIFRPMVPIWGEYMRRIKDDVGAVWKEYEAMRLLKHTWIAQSEPLHRLRQYIETSVEWDSNSNTDTSAILKGLGSAEKPEWLMSMTAIRRMAVGDIDASEENGTIVSIISNIYGFVTSTLKDLDRKFDGGIKEKHPEDSHTDDESSKLESYRVKQDVTAGDIMMFSVYTEDVVRMVHHIDVTVDHATILACLENTKGMDQLFIRKHHLTLCQWVMQSNLPARAIPCLTKPALLRVMASVQAILWHWGYPELAALVTADAVPDARSNVVMAEGRSRIPKELIEELAVLFPHADPGDKNSATNVKSNRACLAIAALTKELAMETWQLKAPNALVKSCQGVDAYSRLTAPQSVQEMLARLVIQLTKKQQELAEV